MRALGVVPFAKLRCVLRLAAPWGACVCSVLISVFMMHASLFMGLCGFWLPVVPHWLLHLFLLIADQLTCESPSVNTTTTQSGRDRDVHHTKKGSW